jgi:hypothetical protein
MKTKKIGNAKSTDKRGTKDLSARKSGDVRGGVRDAASGLPTGKRTHKPIALS